MRKLILLSAFILTTLYCKAQTISYGAFVGLNETSIPIVYKRISYANVTQGGYNFGGVVNFKLNKYISFQPGLYFTKKGGTTLNDTVEISTGIPRSVGSTKMDLFYGEVPINLIFNVPLADANFFAGGGPYLATIFSKSLLFRINGDGQAYSGSPESPPTLNDNDLGYNILAGIKFAKGITIRIAYEKSLTSIYEGQPSAKNQGFNYSIGYFFK